MKSIKIYGGTPLKGVVKIQGSKNSALPIIAATILNKGTSVLHNCPKIIDVLYMRRILESIGCKTHWEEDTLVIDAAGVDGHKIPTEYAETMRSSIIMLGSLIGRTRQAEVSFPGGCVIGARPIDLHLKALECMNIKITEEDGILSAKTEEIKGAGITFAFQSVGATENAILAAVCAKGTTSLHNCAREPEIEELARFLNQMGACIIGAGTGDITIEGVDELHDIEYEIVSDRIVAGTYAMAAIGTRGVIEMQHAPNHHLGYLQDLTKQMGAVCQMEEERCYIDGRNAVRALPYAETVPYPGFPTDMQSQLITALTTARGVSRVRESIFEARFKVIHELQKMNAGITIEGNEAVIQGTKSLKGCEVTAEELRGGVSLVIAGLMAEGCTHVKNRHFIDRGYEDICRDFRALGGKISE